MPEHQSTGSEPRGQDCWRCDFASGQRGMDRCHACDGTGRVFVVGTGAGVGSPGMRVFAGTPDGLKAAWEALAA